MSNLGCVRIRASVAVATLLIAGGIARAETGAQDASPVVVASSPVVVASSADDCDYSRHPPIDRRHPLAVRRLPNGQKALANRRIVRPHPVTAATPHEGPSLVVADNRGSVGSPFARPVSAASICAVGITWNLICPGAQVIGVTY